MTQHTPATTFSLTINRTINAPREEVFEAWTDPERLRRWWGVAEGWTTVIAEVDLRVGHAGAGQRPTVRGRGRLPRDCASGEARGYVYVRDNSPRHTRQGPLGDPGQH